MPLRLLRCTSGRDVNPLTRSVAARSSGFERRLGDGAAHRRFGRRNFREFIERLAAENLVHAVRQLFHRRAVQDFLRGRLQQKLAVGMRERVMRHERSDVAELGGFGFQKFAPRRDGIENIGHADRGSHRHARGLHAEEFAAGKFDARSLALLPRRAFRVAGARWRRSKAALLRETPAWRSRANRRRCAALRWRGARRPAARRRDSCRSRRRSRGSGACRPIRFRCESSARRRPARFRAALSPRTRAVRLLRPPRFYWLQFSASMRMRLMECVSRSADAPDPNRRRGIPRGLRLRSSYLPGTGCAKKYECRTSWP